MLYEKLSPQQYLIFFSLLGVSILCMSALQKEAEEAPPNFILIVGDDHGNADLGFLNIMDDVSTPNFDRLARAGVYFSEAYATSPICSPSRMALITGVYHQRFGTYWYGGEGIHDPAYPTIAELLKSADYSTGYVGKVHYGLRDSDTTNRNFPLNHGFDFFMGHTSARKHYLIHNDQTEKEYRELRTEYRRKGQSLQMGAMWKDRERMDTAAFSTALIGSEARHFIRENKDSPFFLQVAFNAVHNFTHQLPDDYLTANGLEGYRDWDPEIEKYYDWYQQGRYPNNPEGRAQYLGQLFYLDLEIGLLLDELVRQGLSENTVVIYIGDNGGSTPIYANNTPLRGSKYMLYEGGIRVPMVISYPGQFESTISDNMVSALDILPTICELAGVALPDLTDGFSLVPLLNGSDPRLEHETLYWETTHEKAIRHQEWKWHQATDNTSASYEMVELELGEFLRNLEEDIGESRDFSSGHSEQESDLKEALNSWSSSIGNSTTQ